MDFKGLERFAIGIKKEIEDKIEELNGIENITEPLYGNNCEFGGILHITRHSDDGKMSGFYSLSTSNLLNENCLRNMKHENTVCYKCYATRSGKRYLKLTTALIWNTVILKKYSLSENQLPDLFNVSYFRFEAFGDVANLCQLRNYVNICRKNPDTNFSIWTKNIEIFRVGFGVLKIQKPENLAIVYSSPMVNMKAYANDELYFKKKYASVVDIRFTVYTKQFSEMQNIEIDCKGKCRNCMKCYKLESKSDGIFDISELLK